MNTTIKTGLAAILFLASSCKKENNTIQSSYITDKSSTSDVITDITDRYTSVRIGTQKWMTKNLDVAHYRNGDRIPQIEGKAAWAALTTGAWCWYHNDSATGAVYGKLYNWYAVNDPRGLAPTGWHIPSDAEWDTLSTHLGNNAGGKLKDTGTIEAGTGLWYTPNTGATNKTGFTGLPGGFRYNYGKFGGIGTYGYWWTSTVYATYNALSRDLFYFSGSIGKVAFNQGFGFYVRCIRD